MTARAIARGMSITSYLQHLVVSDLEAMPPMPDPLPDTRHGYEDRFLFKFPLCYAGPVAKRAASWGVSINEYLLILVQIDLTSLQH